MITICSLLGYYFASKIAKKISNISLFFVFCCLYLFFLVLLPFSNFPMFLVIQCGLAFAGYIANYLYVSIAQTISVNARYKTVVYQLLLMSQSIANIVFTPIGTSLSAFISVETLIFFSSILLAFSCGIQLILVLINKIAHIKEFKWSFCSLLIIWCVLLGLINSNTMSFTTRKPDQWPNVRITLTKKRKIRFSRLELCDNSKYGRTI